MGKDTTLWGKMRAVLVPQKAEKALEDPSKLPPTLTNQQMIEITNLSEGYNGSDLLVALDRTGKWGILIVSKRLIPKMKGT